METPDSDLLLFPPSTYEEQWEKAVKFLMGEDNDNGSSFNHNLDKSFRVRHSGSYRGNESYKREK